MELKMNQEQEEKDKQLIAGLLAENQSLDE